MTAAALGVDVGSTTCKAVAVDEVGRILKSAVEPADPRVEPQVLRLLEAVKGEAGPLVPVGATGYGRKRVKGGRGCSSIWAARTPRPSGSGREARCSTSP